LPSNDIVCGVPLIRIGYLLHKTPSGRLLVKLTTKRPPRIGAKVIDSSGKIIGRVIDIIGNVSSPYALVKPASEDIELTQHSELFIKPDFRREKK